MARIEDQKVDKKTKDLADDIFYGLYESQRKQILDKVEEATGKRDENLADIAEIGILKELLPEEELEKAKRLQKIDPKSFRENFVMITMSHSIVKQREAGENQLAS